MKQVYIKIKTCEIKKTIIKNPQHYRISIQYNNISYYSRILFNQTDSKMTWNDIFLMPYNRNINFLTLSIEQVFFSTTNIECLEINKIIVKIPTFDIESKYSRPFSFDIGDLFYGYKNHIFHLQTKYLL